jgi:hypothetical protein
LPGKRANHAGERVVKKPTRKKKAHKPRGL